MDNLQYLQAFLDESLGNTQHLNALCLKIEQQPPTDEDFAAMFRAAHTLKGMSATMGFHQLANLTHKLEDALGFLRQHPRHLNGAVMDALFACIDALEQDLEVLRETGDEATSDHTALIERLDREVRGGRAGAREETAATSTTSAGIQVFKADETALAAAAQCREMGLAVGVLTVTLDQACQMKGPRAIMVNRRLEEHGHCLSCWPPADVLESGTFDENVLYFLAALETDVARCTQAISNISEVVRVTFVDLERWNEAGQVASPAETLPLTENSAPDVSSAPVANVTTQKPERIEKIERTVRVPVERLDGLMNYLSELVIDKTRLSAIADQIGNSDLRTLSDHLSRVANELQSAVMSLRMVPVDTLFQRFPRMVRDLAKTLNKDIRLEMSGLDTEFDRTIIDEMGEALVHLIRNSADHGLESTEARLAAGKSATGTIFLRAYSSGQRVFIEVADDGSGIDVEKVRQRAVDRGILDAAKASKLARQEVYELIFESGFSTADQVSDISGRGVGLDAVRRKVESLGGSITVESEQGQGSTFRIQLPLTLSILQALLTVVDGDTFAVPLDSVAEVVSADETMLTTVHGRTVLNHGGKLIPILDAGDWLYGKPSTGVFPLQLVVCREGTRYVAVAVDQWIGQQEVVHKSLGNYLESVRWFAGATILGDGKIALILDVHALMNQLS